MSFSVCRRRDSNKSLASAPDSTLTSASSYSDLDPGRRSWWKSTVMAPSPPSSSVLSNVTVNDAAVLGCGLCFLPLKAPIFQCVVGHMVCAPCRDKAAAGGAVTGYPRRCHDMERVVDAVRVPCPYAAAHGCKATPAYHGRERHARACAHAPCRCPGEACRFAVATAELLLPDLATTHGWPCATKSSSAGEIASFTVQLREGFNFVHVGAGGEGRRWRHLFLLNMAMGGTGCAVNVLCVHPRDTPPSKEIKFELEYTGYFDARCRDSQLVNHYQKSEFRVVCTDLFAGLPHPDDSFQFLVPWSVLEDDQGTIQVTASTYLIN
ncbi:hypothetical protein QOZ80_1BG0070620 [Eleusine coracana subsp. coracana]|nr:hypothetical protein QOZ80_1BG0070620 [Eleusine coracana subsp. coracana]